MKTVITLCCLLLTISALAQPGIAEMQQAKQELTADFFSAFDCSLILATLLGLNGAAKIYHNIQMGKERMDADVAAWFYAAFFMILAGAFLRALFGI
jgi:hypothetical protein